MRVHRIKLEQSLAKPPEVVFPFFADALNLERLTPPWLHFKLLSQSTEAIDAGTLIRYRLRLRGVPIRWLTRIERWEPNRRFVDLQLRGPYRYWHHTHEFLPEGDGTLMRDTVRYAMRAGRVGELAQSRFVAGDLGRIFDFRRERIRELFDRTGPPG